MKAIVQDEYGLPGNVLTLRENSSCTWRFSEIGAGASASRISPTGAEVGSVWLRAWC